MMWLSPYHGASTGDARGYVYWPQLDTKKQLDTYSRVETLRRARAFEGNSGIARKAIHGLARKIGFLLPQPVTRDQEWNRAAYSAFMRRATNADTFDVSGKHDFADAQIALSKYHIRDGERLTVKALSKANRAMFAFYESQQIRQPEGTENPRWKDGIYVSPLGRLSAFHVRDPDDTGKGEIYLAEQCIFIAHRENHHQIRGSTQLIACLNHIQDTDEIKAAVKKNIKTAAMLGLVRTMEGQNKPPGGLIGSARRSQINTPGTSGSATDPTSIDINWEMVMSTGVIPNIGPGEDLKILHDDRPAPSQQEFLKAIKRDIAHSLDFSPEVLWDISDLTGPGVRYVMGDVREALAVRRRPLRRWCRDVYVHLIAQELATGNLQPCRDPEWWQVDWQSPADITIDAGRDGALALQQLDAGMITLQDWYQATKGQGDWRNPIDQRVAEVKYAVEACATAQLPYDLVFPRRQGAPAPATAAPARDPDPDPDDPDGPPGEE